MFKIRGRNICWLVAVWPPIVAVQNPQFSRNTARRQQRPPAIWKQDWTSGNASTIFIDRTALIMKRHATKLSKKSHKSDAKCPEGGRALQCVNRTNSACHILLIANLSHPDMGLM